jgi:sporulation protein YlmC with PRC-barrel domain
MLQVASALKGYAIEATDGRIGTVSDFLFDDKTWKIRWLVVDTGGWLSGRKVLIHPSALGTADHERLELPVSLTMAKVKDSPDIAQDRPVSQQMESSLFTHYGWDPMWGGGSYFGGLSMGYPLGATPYFGREPVHAIPDTDGGADLAVNDGDPHLRSLSAIRGYQVHATDGDIGHVENFLIDDAAWGVRYLIIDTRNWWPGQHVLISPYAVQEISWSEHHVRLDVSRERVKTSPPWDPARMIDEVAEKRVHTHYDWPGYGW